MNDIEMTFLTLVSAVCCIFACKPTIVNEKNISRKVYTAAALLALALCVAVRVFKFGEYPIGMNQDGAMGAVDALALAQYGTDRFGMKLPVHFTAWGFGQMSVLLSYLTVPFIWIFGELSITVARLPMLFSSLAGIIILFFFTKRIAGKRTALIVLFFAAINPWHIMQSRWALDCNLLPHFFLFSVMLLHVGLEKKWALYLSMVFFGLTMYTYGIAFYAVPIFLISACGYLLIKKRVEVKQAVICAVVYILAAWPIFMMILINFFSLPSIETPLFTIPFFPDTQRLSDIIFFSERPVWQFRENLLTFIGTVILQGEDLPWNNISQIGPMYIFAVPFLLTGLYSLVSRVKEKVKSGSQPDANRRDGLALLIIWLITSVVSGCVINWVNINRINIVFYPMIIVLGFGIHFVITRVKLTKIPLAFIFLFGFLSFNTLYFYTQPVEFYSGFGMALEDVRDAEYDRIYVTTTTQGENSYWTTEILTQFHHALDAEYTQGIKTLYDDNNNELLPYSERYRYEYLPSSYIDPDENAVYIAPVSQLYLFPESEYEIRPFIDFAAIYPIQRNP